MAEVSGTRRAHRGPPPPPPPPAPQVKKVHPRAADARRAVRRAPRGVGPGPGAEEGHGRLAELAAPRCNWWAVTARTSPIWTRPEAGCLAAVGPGTVSPGGGCCWPPPGQNRRSPGARLAVRTNSAFWPDAVCPLAARAGKIVAPAVRCSGGATIVTPPLPALGGGGGPARSSRWRAELCIASRLPAPAAAGSQQPRRSAWMRRPRAARNHRAGGALAPAERRSGRMRRLLVSGGPRRSGSAGRVRPGIEKAGPTPIWRRGLGAFTPRWEPMPGLVPHNFQVPGPENRARRSPHPLYMASAISGRQIPAPVPAMARPPKNIVAVQPRTRSAHFRSVLIRRGSARPVPVVPPHALREEIRSDDRSRGYAPIRPLASVAP